MTFIPYSVGDVVCSPCAEEMKIDLTDGGFILLIKFNNPTAKEKNSIKSAVAQFKFAVIDDIIFFLCRFGANNWMDAPFHRDLAQATKIDPIEQGQGLSLHIMLIDASTGILAVQRLIGLSNVFSENLRRTIIEQPLLTDPRAYLAKISDLYSKYTTQDLVDLACASN